MSISSIKEHLSLLAGLDEPPQEVALSFALGVFIGCSPFLGFHLVLAFFTAWLLQIVSLPAMAGVFVSNPFTIAPLYGANLWVGMKLTGEPFSSLAVDFSHFTLHRVFHEMGGLLWPFLLGSLVDGFFAGMIAFLAMYAVIKGKKDWKDAGNTSGWL